jgi:hypothetical protein
MRLVEMCQQHFPHLHILARARGRVEAHELLQAGVTQFSRETFSSALSWGVKRSLPWDASSPGPARSCTSDASICECCVS